MPFGIQKQGDRFCIYNKETRKVINCDHMTEESAMQQMQAMMDRESMSQSMMSKPPQKKQRSSQ